MPESSSAAQDKIEGSEAERKAAADRFAEIGVGEHLSYMCLQSAPQADAGHRSQGKAK